MPKPKSTVRKGVRMTKDGPKVIVTKKSKGPLGRILSGFGK